MRFPKSFLDDIRARVPISDVVGRRVTWDKRKSAPQRGDYWACCPFHGEKTPSFHADDRKGRYYCFGCGASGDQFRFLVDQEGMSFPDAVEDLARQAGLPLPQRDPESERREQQRDSLIDVVEMACGFFERELHGPNGGTARAYLRERGLDGSVQARFRIGYAPNDRSALKSFLAGKGIDHDRMVAAGLLIAGDDIPVSYDRFRGRVMFPIMDLGGRVIAFGGRALSPDVPAKYLNSPETELFHKGSILFNAKGARDAARKAGAVVAVEGYVDVITCVAAGFEATVAPLGTALTDSQLALLWRMSDEPILCFDGDTAGLKAADRAIDVALPHLAPGKTIRFMILPDGLDPDDLIRRRGAPAFADLIAHARPLIDMFWRRETENRPIDTPERRAALERDVRQGVRVISDEDVRRHYETALRDRLEALLGSRRTGRRNDSGRSDRRRSAGPAAPVLASEALLRSRLAHKGEADAFGPGLRDAILVGALIAHPTLAESRLERLAELALRSNQARKLADALAFALTDDPDADHDRLRAALEESECGDETRNLLSILARAGLRDLLPGGDSARAAQIWDDAALLRDRVEALSKERAAVASHLTEETGDVHLDRLRTLQSEEGRIRSIGEQAAVADTEIEHPFRGASRQTFKR